jgi:predicted nucleotidyltransferase component of viral defense system
MIPKRFIQEWKHKAPWDSPDHVEQDLIISRVLVEIFSDDLLKEHLAFRGGTALHKLYLSPAPRYSEDIDLVQIKKGPIKPILKRIGETITFFEEGRVVKQKANNNTILYRFTSENFEIPLKLKIEIKCREHFNIYDWKAFPYNMNNGWFSGSAEITTYDINELLGTKLRALYQRKKGRDLFDLHYAKQNTDLHYDKIIHAYKEYMNFVVDKKPTQKQFLRNIEDKEKDRSFLTDTEGLLRSEVKYEQEEAFEWIKHKIISKV